MMMRPRLRIRLHHHCPRPQFRRPRSRMRNRCRARHPQSLRRVHIQLPRMHNLDSMFFPVHIRIPSPIPAFSRPNKWHSCLCSWVCSADFYASVLGSSVFVGSQHRRALCLQLPEPRVSYKKKQKNCHSERSEGPAFFFLPGCPTRRPRLRVSGFTKTHNS